MNAIEITGGMTLSALLTSFGKVVDKSTRKITLAFEVHSALKLVAQGAQVNADDKASVLATMTQEQRLIVAGFEAACKEAARNRADGKFVERWTVTGTASKV